MKVQSLDRTFDILELLSKEQYGLNLTEIGNRLNLHKSTVYRLLNSLKNRGYIEKKTSNGMYRLGLGFIELCSLYLNNLELKTEAEPFLRNLSSVTTQTVYLATLLDNEVIYIDKYEQFNSIRKYSIIGNRRPLYCTSLGKAFLMGMNNNLIRELYKNKELTYITPQTLTDVDSLIKDIELSRERGWTFDNEECEADIQCIGAPIYDYRNNIIAAISTSANKSILKDLKLETVADHVLDTSMRISRYMGYRNNNN